MDLTPFFKSVIDQDTAPVVLCSLDHTIIYMNEAAINRYASAGGSALVGKSILLCHNSESGEKIDRVLKWFNESRNNNIVFESRNEIENKDVYMVALRGGDGELIGYYEKHEYRNHEQGEPYDFK